MSEQPERITPQKPTPEQIAETQAVVDVAKGIVTNYHQWRKELGESVEFDDAMTRYLATDINEADEEGVERDEKHLLHAQRGGYGVDLSVRTPDGTSVLNVQANGFASMYAIDAEGVLLAESGFEPISEGQLAFAASELDLFTGVGSAGIELSGIHEWARKTR